MVLRVAVRLEVETARESAVLADVETEVAKVETEERVVDKVEACVETLLTRVSIDVSRLVARDTSVEVASDTLLA